MIEGQSGRSPKVLPWIYDHRGWKKYKRHEAANKNAFCKRRELLTKSMSKELKKRMAKTLVWPVALYGCETWTMRREEMDRLDAFEMWIWRK